MRRLWPDRWATPGWWLRCRLNRCQATERLCFRKPIIHYPLPACPRHYDGGWWMVGRLIEAIRSRPRVEVDR